MDVHECVMKPDVKEMAEGVKTLTIDVALMKSDVTDLKSATMLMSGCIRTLTESSIIAQQNHVTREKFYEKLDILEKRISSVENISDQVKNMSRWIQGVVATLVVFIIIEGYRFVVR